MILVSEKDRIKDSITTSSDLWKGLGAVCAVLFYEAFLGLWRLYVRPSPDFQYLEFFSNFLNYLTLSQYLGNDFPRLIQLGFDSDYPLGFAILPWLIVGWGAQELFLNNPWFLNIFFTIPIALVPAFMPWSKKQCTFYWGIIFFFPGTQILLKGFNPQAPILVYSLVALLAYFSYLRAPRKDKLIAFFMFAWLAMSIKHLGVFYFAIFFLTTLVWRFLRSEKPTLELGLALLLALSLIPVYPIESLGFYLSHVITAHNPYFSMWQFLIILFVSLVGGTFGMLALKRRMGKNNLATLLSAPMLLIGGMIVWFLCTYLQLSSMVSVLSAGLCVILSFIAGGWFIIKNDATSVDALEVLVTSNLFGYSTALYLSLVGHTSYIFILPLLLMIALLLNQVTCIQKLVKISILMVFLSNFFPSQQLISQLFDAHNYYFRIFNTIDQNPLGWQKSHLAGARKDLIKILERYDYDLSFYESGIKVGCFGIDLDMFGFHFDVLTHFPTPDSNKIFQDSFFKLYFASIKERDLNIFDSWIERAQIPILIAKRPRAEDSLKQLLDKALSDLIAQASEASEVWHFERDLFEILMLRLRMRPDLAAHYSHDSFGFGEEVFDFFIHKEIRPRRTSITGPNYYLYREIQVGR